MKAKKIDLPSLSIGFLSSESQVLKADWIETPLEPMIAIADEKDLYLLEFAGRHSLEREIENLRRKTNSAIAPGTTGPIHSIAKELHQYFKGDLKIFQTPVKMIGSSFQKEVWLELQQIPMGETRSYSDVAKRIKKPLAIRAVGRANGTNQLAIVVPCHRVINANGDLGGYAGGIAKKEWLLSHEKSNKRK